MYKESIQHQSLELSWVKPHQIIEPKTIVLGSFNPYENNNKIVDYYYGRSTNHFWKAIAELTNKDTNYFFDTQFGLQRKIEIMQNRFCCLDVIDSIDFTCQDQNTLRQYLSNEIFSNFADQKIWVSKTAYTNKNEILLSRNYNQLVIDSLKTSNSIKKIIHTMGNQRISSNSVNPKEKQKGINGFSGYIQVIKEICAEHNITFVEESYSPSNYAVKNKSTDINDLMRWLKTNLYL